MGFHGNFIQTLGEKQRKMTENNDLAMKHCDFNGMYCWFMIAKLVETIRVTMVCGRYIYNKWVSSSGFPSNQTSLRVDWKQVLVQNTWVPVMFIQKKLCGKPMCQNRPFPAALCSSVSVKRGSYSNGVTFWKRSCSRLWLVGALQLVLRRAAVSTVTSANHSHLTALPWQGFVAFSLHFWGSVDLPNGEASSCKR